MAVSLKEGFERFVRIFPNGKKFLVEDVDKSRQRFLTNIALPTVSIGLVGCTALGREVIKATSTPTVKAEVKEPLGMSNPANQNPSWYFEFRKVAGQKVEPTPEANVIVVRTMIIDSWENKNTFSTTKWIEGVQYNILIRKFINDEVVITVNGKSQEEVLPKNWKIVNPEGDTYQLIQLKNK